jgi:hypothetical protein
MDVALEEPPERRFDQGAEIGHGFRRVGDAAYIPGARTHHYFLYVEVRTGSADDAGRRRATAL